MHFLFLLRALFDRGRTPDDVSLVGEMILDRAFASSGAADRSSLGVAGSSGSSGVAPRGLRTEVELVQPSVLQVAFRLGLLAGLLVYWTAAKLYDWLVVGWSLLFSLGGAGLRQETLVQRRAVRLRRILQRLGATFVKVGQQMSIRADVLAPAYCRELEKLLDRAGPLNQAYVRDVVESEIGRPLDDVFEEFDWNAIGQASISCVYQARLTGGDRVAVKIRRPRIVETFKADLAALGLVLRLAEFLTILRPGLTTPLREELGKLLLEELDLRIEARYQELFRRYIKGWSALNVTAPAIYPALCTERLMVSELIDDALSARRILEIISDGDAEGHRELQERNIDPVEVGRNLIRASHFQFFDCPFFHGDPHPANILVRDDNEVVLIDFGACGVFAESQRNYLRRMNYYQAREDIGGMVQCVIRLMEPLPPIEITAFRRDLESAWWQGFYGIQSRHADWWERTSFQLWTALLTTVREYEVPMPLNVLRMIRATLLYDTVGARLHPRLDVFEEFQHYLRFAAKRTKRDFEAWFTEQLVCGIDPLLFLRARQVVDVADGLVFEAQRFLSRTTPSFSALVSKGFTLVRLAIQWLFWSSLATVIAALYLAVMRFAQLPQAKPLSEMSLPDYTAMYADFLQIEFQQPGLGPAEWAVVAWVAVIALLTIKLLRDAGYRLKDKDQFL